MNIDPATMPVRERYALLIASIVPRPIAWISTLNAQGVTNLAPFSFFTGITAEPMSVVFAPVNNRDGIEKDTLINVRQTKQFAVNIVGENDAEKMNATSASYPYGVSEFEKAGIVSAPSVKIRPPRVASAPISMECELLKIVDLSDGPLGGHLVIGHVVYFHADDKIWNGGNIRHQDVNAVGRMEGAWYTRTRDAFELARPEVLK